jgi:hypothetical protein
VLPGTPDQLRAALQGKGRTRVQVLEPGKTVKE